MTVYLVSRGKYSDWCVLGLYSTPEKAEEAHAYYASNNRIEQWELDAPIPDHPPGTRMYKVDIKRDGHVESCIHCPPDDMDISWMPQPSYLERNVTSPPLWFSFWMWAVDKTAAIKIANEQRLACIADGRWTENYAADLKRWEYEREATGGLGQDLVELLGDARDLGGPI